MPGSPNITRLPVGGAHACVRRPVVEADVRLHLHDPPDPPRGHAGEGVADQSGPQQGAGGGERVAGEDLAREGTLDRAVRRPAAAAWPVSGHLDPVEGQDALRQDEREDAQEGRDDGLVQQRPCRRAVDRRPDAAAGTAARSRSGGMFV